MKKKKYINDFFYLNTFQIVVPFLAKSWLLFRWAKPCNSSNTHGQELRCFVEETNIPKVVKSIYFYLTQIIRFWKGKNYPEVMLSLQIGKRRKCLSG